jgi:hypothetical protein
MYRGDSWDVLCDAWSAESEDITHVETGGVCDIAKMGMPIGSGGCFGVIYVVHVGEGSQLVCLLLYDGSKHLGCGNGGLDRWAAEGLVAIFANVRSGPSARWFSE